MWLIIHHLLNSQRGEHSVVDFMCSAQHPCGLALCVSLSDKWGTWVQGDWATCPRSHSSWAGIRVQARWFQVHTLDLMAHSWEEVRAGETSEQQCQEGPWAFLSVLYVTEEKGRHEREDRPVCLSGRSGPDPDPVVQGPLWGAPCEVAPPLEGAVDCRHQECHFIPGMGEGSHSLFAERKWAVKEGLLDDVGSEGFFFNAL